MILDRSDLATASRAALQSAREIDADSYRQYVVCLGAEIADGNQFLSHIELLNPTVPKDEKPALTEYARDLLADTTTLDELNDTGVVKVDLTQTGASGASSATSEKLRYFYSRQNHPRSSASESRIHWRVWAFSNEVSSTEFGPLTLRLTADELDSRLIAKASTRSEASFARAIRGGAVGPALDILVEIASLKGAIGWYYDNETEHFVSFADSNAPSGLKVPTRRREGVTRVGIVSQVRPNRAPVIYDVKDRDAWRPPFDGSWVPFDDGPFAQSGFRSCLAIPIVLAGRLLGALTVYSEGSAHELVAIEDVIARSAYLLTGPILTIRERRMFRDLVDKYDNELLRSNVSLSALSLSHDVLHYYKLITTQIGQARSYLSTKQYALVKSHLDDASDALQSTQPALGAMRRLAEDARASETEVLEGDRRADPARVLRSMESLLRSILPMMSKRNVLDSNHIYFEYEGTPLEVALGSTSLERIFLNLCVNSAQWRATEVHVATRFAEDRVNLVVRDNGKGIKEADRPRVFDRFFTGRSDGSGLGLHVVRSLVTRAGGDVFVQSHDEHDTLEFRGTTVTVSLPRFHELLT